MAGRWTCVHCNAGQYRAWVDVTEIQDSVRQYLPGLWSPCRLCGNTKAPILVEPAPSMRLVPYGPPVPTPDDLLRGAGLLA